MTTWTATQRETAKTRTLGCRHSNMLTCGRNGIDKVCALVRDDGMCLAPPSSWVRFYRGVVAREDETDDALLDGGAP